MTYQPTLFTEIDLSKSLTDTEAGRKAILYKSAADFKPYFLELIKTHFPDFFAICYETLYNSIPSVHGELLGLDCGLLGLYHIPDQHYAFMLLRWGDNTTTVGYSDDVKLQAHLKALTKAEAVIGLCQTDTNITEELINKIISLTEMPYSPLTIGFTQTYQLKELFECSLLEGTTVPPHDDGIEGYRVFLMLRNPGYIIRGRGQTITRQRPGAGFVLNLKMTHEVHAIDPNSNPAPWLALTMGPYLKAEYNPVAAMTDGLVKFNTLIHCCQSLG